MDTTVSIEMEKSVISQLLEAGGALGVGAVLGIVYDFLRCARNEFAGCAFHLLCDFFFAVGASAALFAYGMHSPSGCLTLYIAALAAAGAMLYFAVAGRTARHLFSLFLRFLSRILRFTNKKLIKVFIMLKKIKKILKNIFSRAKKWFTITGKVVDCENPDQGRKGQQSEVQEDRLSHESSYRGPDYLRCDKHIVNPLSNIAGGTGTA